jgi:hypothetical protein
LHKAAPLNSCQCSSQLLISPLPCLEQPLPFPPLQRLPKKRLSMKTSARIPLDPLSEPSQHHVPMAAQFGPLPPTCMGTGAAPNPAGPGHTRLGARSAWQLAHLAVDPPYRARACPTGCEWASDHRRRCHGRLLPRSTLSSILKSMAALPS